MEKYPECTPCPTDSKWNAHNVFHEDVTGELNYTTEFKAALRNAAPRRRTSLMTKPEMVADDRLREVTSYLSKQRKESGPYLPGPNVSTHQHASARRRDSQIIAQHVNDISSKDSTHDAVVFREDVSKICKRPRRRTLYIPPDDTTFTAMSPGLKPADKLQNKSLEQGRAINHAIQLEGDVHHSESNVVKRRSLAAAPKRAPLLPTLKPLQEINDQCDLNGIDTGKENVAPGLALGFKPKLQGEISSKARRVSIFQTVPEEYSSKLAGPHDHHMPEGNIVGHIPTNLENVRSSRQPASPKSMSEQDRKRVRRASMMKRRNSIYYGTSWKALPSSERSDPQPAPLAPLLPTVSLQKSADTKIHYQIPREDIERPEMFEETWLSCQEFAIQQLVNRFFDTAAERKRGCQHDRHESRAKILNLYQDCDSAIIFKRLNASLLYGTLNPPKDSVVDIGRLQTDVGLRQAFLDLWLNSYDLEALISVAEVVVGRNVLPVSLPDSKLPREKHEAKKERTRSTRAFIESCLLRNEDAQGLLQISTPIWCWRRTMLRSLMMVMLLDKIKERGLLYRNLFCPTSKLKSSRDVLNQLCSLISPFLGDLTRPLAHLHYDLHHVQHPLSEYQYGISNLATDLRDGVQLTHLVELLLHPSEARIGSSEELYDALPRDTAITRPHDAQHPWPLSQHLKVPCFNWSQKVYNVQIALSALRDLCGVDEILTGIKPEDIVNGHRERTVILLWSLIGKRGLEQMIDFEEVRREIRRLSRKSTLKEGPLRESGIFQGRSKLVKDTDLLRQWAHSIADQRGLSVTNLTTSFSDGRIFTAIMDEYQRFLPKSCPAKNQNTSRLTTRLKEIGCSDAFAKIFACNDKGRIFHRDFTVSALAFLCSRLLSASRRGIAASVILEAYRQSKIRRKSHKYWSADYTQGRVINAARILQRNWREYTFRKHRSLKLERHRATRREKREAVGEQEARKKEDHMDIWLP